MIVPLLDDATDDLRLLDAFLPRILFGKVASTGSGNPSGATDESSGTSRGSNVDTKGFAYLKRDLVRLLGILCHGNRAVQDRVRHCGGITVVMNLCVVDERNPCTYIYVVLGAFPTELAFTVFIACAFASPITDRPFVLVSMA